ncbi:zf-TFIIB domain-containing protein [Myxococcus sp. K15C18031901]|uniref:TFIIB-type zinc ribbon-containing protein n=1 Tax=Myxococcus dinghuensis TaxID=2906761 RepID=UPI0020A6DBB0|nr:zf-TFIIB domain-containing protein [Myxococcus dinghuensis]MCP3098082.1 zf-TFIIB domain-containing protein [Myxococcus dinghuensis]
MPARACPSCRAPLQPLLADRVLLDRCFACKAMWFDAGELGLVAGTQGTPEMTREQPAAKCPACAGMLWFARLGACELLACIECGGNSVSDAQFARATQEGAARKALPRLEFVCVGCKDRYPLTQCQRVVPGLACARCAERFPPAPAPCHRERPVEGAAKPTRTASDDEWRDWWRFVEDLFDAI